MKVASPPQTATLLGNRVSFTVHIAVRHEPVAGESSIKMLVCCCINLKDQLVSLERKCRLVRTILFQSWFESAESETSDGRSAE